MFTAFKDSLVFENVTRAADELRALATLIERVPLGPVSLSLDIALRAAFAVHEVLAHIERTSDDNGIRPEAMGSAAMLSYASMGSFGRCDFDQLREAVHESKSGTRDAPLFDPSYSAGHQIIYGINYNSLDRIVTAFVESALAPLQGDGTRTDLRPFSQAAGNLGHAFCR